MADIADITSAREEIQENLDRKYRESLRSEVSLDCVDCSKRIPEARQQATGGTDTCIECQELIEIKGK